jgi:hypothetical protein
MTTLFIGLLVGFWLNQNASAEIEGGVIRVGFSFREAIADLRSAVQTFLDAGLTAFRFGQKVRDFAEAKVIPVLASAGVEISIPNLRRLSA